MTMTAMSLRSERAIADSDEKRRVVTLKEMAEHTTAEDCWIAISGKVRKPLSVFPIGSIDRLDQPTALDLYQLFPFHVMLPLNPIRRRWTVSTMTHVDVTRYNGLLVHSYV